MNGEAKVERNRSALKSAIKFKDLHNIEYRECDKVLIASRERLVGDPGMDKKGRL